MTDTTIAPDILEVTLRDGSYLIDFQFTAGDTALVVSALENVGFRWIEVGHGLGLNASSVGSRAAAATDEEYMEATARSLTKARWGMFFIPGIGRAEDLRLAARYRMPFVRIGTNINEIQRAQPFIELAKELGMIVSYNAMKSYAVTPADFFGGPRQRPGGGGSTMRALSIRQAGCIPTTWRRTSRPPPRRATSLSDFTVTTTCRSPWLIHCARSSAAPRSSTRRYRESAAPPGTL